MPGRLRLRAHDSSSSSTTPYGTVLRVRFSAPVHIATASVTRHLAAKCFIPKDKVASRPFAGRLSLLK